MDGEKRYDEKAAAEILRRAAELERARAGGPVGGLTRADLEKVAVDAGLDPAAVRAAIAEHERSGETLPGAGLFGGPLSASFERELEGELDEEGVEQVLASAQQALGMHGRWYRSGRLWSWSPEGVTRQLRVSVEVQDGRTRLRLEERLGGLAGALWGGLFGGSIGAASGLALPIGLAALHSPSAALALFGAMMAGSFFLTRHLFRSLTRKRHREMQELADRLAGEAARELEAIADSGPGRQTEEAGRSLHRERRRDRDDDDRRRPRGRSRD